MTTPHTNSTPRFTFGIPVYNGEHTLKETLDCCAKMPGDLVRVVVSDNGSTDGTYAMAQAYAERHPYISVYRHEQNMGAANNFKYLLDNCRTEYFMWLAADDVIADSLSLAEVERLFQQYPRAMAVSPYAMVERVLERFDIKRVVLVADRGLLPMDNLEALAKIRLPSDCPLEFVLAVPARRYAEFAPLIETMGAGLEADWVREDRWPSGPDLPSLRLVVSHNETAARELTSQRRDRIRMLEEQAQRWASKLDAQDEGGRSRGRKLSDSGAKARFFHAVADAHLSSILQVDLKSDLCSLGISTRPCSSVTKRSTASSCCSPTSPISRPMRSSNATRAWLTSSADSAYSRARSRSVPSFIDGLIGFVRTPASVFWRWCSTA
jgi:hypothetical protein